MLVAFVISYLICIIYLYSLSYDIIMIRPTESLLNVNVPAAYNILDPRNYYSVSDVTDKYRMAVAYVRLFQIFECSCNGFNDCVYRD